MVEKAREHFRVHYGYVNIDELTDAQIARFLNQGYVKDLAFERQMDLLYDHIVSQGLAEVVE